MQIAFQKLWGKSSYTFCCLLRHFLVLLGEFSLSQIDLKQKRDVQHICMETSPPRVSQKSAQTPQSSTPIESLGMWKLWQVGHNTAQRPWSRKSAALCRANLTNSHIFSWKSFSKPPWAFVPMPWFQPDYSLWLLSAVLLSNPLQISLTPEITLISILFWQQTQLYSFRP